MSSKEYRDSHKEQIKEYRQKNKDKNIIYTSIFNEKLGVSRKEYYRFKSLKYRYNITLDDYNKLLDLQNKCCAICGIHQSELDRGLFVDHNHSTGKVRGLLCDKCNRMLGYARDNSIILEKAVEYIKE